MHNDPKLKKPLHREHLKETAFVSVACEQNTNNICTPT